MPSRAFLNEGIRKQKFYISLLFESYPKCALTWQHGTWSQNNGLTKKVTDFERAIESTKEIGKRVLKKSDQK